MSLDSIIAQELAKLKAGQGRPIRGANPLGKALASPSDKAMMDAGDTAIAKRSGKLRTDAYNPTSVSAKRATQKGTLEYAMQVFDRLHPSADQDTRSAALSYVWARSGGDPDKVSPSIAATAAKLAKSNPQELFRVGDAYRTERSQRAYDETPNVDPVTGAFIRPPAPRQISGPSASDVPNDEAAASYARSNPAEYSGAPDMRPPVPAAISDSIKWLSEGLLGKEVGGAVAPLVDPVSQVDFVGKQIPEMAKLATTPQGRSQLAAMAKESLLSWADLNAPLESRISSGINLSLALIGAPHLLKTLKGAPAALREASALLSESPDVSTSALGKQAQALLKGGAGYSKAPLGFDIQSSIGAALKSGDATTVSLARNVAAKEAAKNFGLSEKSARDMVDVTIRDTMKRMGMNDRTIIADAGVTPDTPSEIAAKAEAEKVAKQAAKEAKATLARPKAAAKPKKTSTETPVVETPKQEVKPVGQEKQAKANGQGRQKGLLSSNDSSAPAVETAARKTAAGTTTEAPALAVGAKVSHPEYGDGEIVSKQPNGMWEMAIGGDKSNTAIVPKKELSLLGEAGNRAQKQGPEPVVGGAKVSPDSGEANPAGQPSPIVQKQPKTEITPEPIAETKTARRVIDADSNNNEIQGHQGPLTVRAWAGMKSDHFTFDDVMASAGNSDHGYAGRGIYGASKGIASIYAEKPGRELKQVEFNFDNPLIRTDANWKDPIMPYDWIPKRTAELESQGVDWATAKAKASAEYPEFLKSKGYDGFIDAAVDGPIGEIVAYDKKSVSFHAKGPKSPEAPQTPKAAEPAASAKKEPWQMTAEEYDKWYHDPQRSIAELEAELKKAQQSREYKDKDRPALIQDAIDRIKAGKGGRLDPDQLAHQRMGDISDALSEGKPVPPAVVDEFLASGGKLPEKGLHPDLAAKYQSTKEVGTNPKDRIQELNALITAERKTSAELRARAKQNRKFAADYRANGGKGMSGVEPFTVLEAKARLNDLHIARLVSARDKLVAESAPKGIDAELARQKKAALTPTPKELKFDYSSRKTIVNGQVAYPATNLDARTVNALGGKSVALIPGEVQELHLLDANGDSIRVISKGRNASSEGLAEIKRQLKEVKPNGQEVKAEAPSEPPVPPPAKEVVTRAPKSINEAKEIFGHDSDEYLAWLKSQQSKRPGVKPGSKQRGAVAPVTKDDVRIAYEIGAVYVRRGVKSVTEFVAKMASEVGDWVRPHAARMFTEISKGNDLDKMSQKTFNALSHKIENPAHTDTAALRDELGYDAYDAKPETVKKWHADASKLNGRELQIAQDAIDDKKRALVPAEEIALGKRLNKFVEEMDKAQASGDHGAWQFAHDSAETIMQALDKKGSEAARGLRARQEFVKASRTPWAQTQRAKAAKGGELTTRERIPIENGAKAEADVAAQSEKATAELKKMRAESALDVPARDRAARRGDIQARRAAAAKTIKTELQRLLAGPAGMILGVGGGGAGADLSALRRAFMEYAKTLVEEAPMALGDVVSRITKDFKLEKTQFDADFLIDSIANEGNRMSMSEAAKNRARLTMEARQAAEDIATNATMRTKLGKQYDKVVNRIAVLEEKVKAGGSAPVKKTPEVVPDALKELVAKRDELQKKLDDLNKAKRPPSGGVTEKGLREAINRLTSRIESGDYSRKPQGKPQVPPELIDLYDQKKFLEKELNRRRTAATAAERRVASLKKTIAEYEEGLKDGGFRPPTSKEKAKSREITNLEIKLARLKKENDLRIMALKPTHWTERVETIFSGLQLSNPMARIKDLAGNTGKLVQESAIMSHARYGYQAAMKKLVADPDFAPRGINPIRKGQLDLFDEPFWAHVKEETKGAFQGIDVDAQKKFGSGTIFHGAAGATDVPFRELYRRAYLRDWAYGNAQIAMPGVSPKAPQFMEMVRESIRNAPETVVRDAHDWSAHMTYNAENIASVWRAAIDRGLKQFRDKEASKGRVITPIGYDMVRALNNATMRFGKVIYNVGVNKARMSPAGLIEGGMKWALAAAKSRKGVKMTTYDARMLSDILARGTIGTAGWALGYYLKKAGVDLPWAGREMVGIKTTPDGQIDYKNDGTPARTSTKFIDQGAVGEISSNLDAAILLGWATAYYAEDHTVKQQSKNVPDLAGAYTKAVMEHMINQPMFGQADLLADVDQNGAASAAANFLVNKFANLGFIAEAARRSDAIKEYGAARGMVYDRPVRVEKKKPLERLAGAMQSKIPVKRGELPTSAIPERW